MVKRSLNIIIIITVIMILLLNFNVCFAQKEEKSLLDVLKSENLKSKYEIKAFKIKSITKQKYVKFKTMILFSEEITSYTPNGDIFEIEYKEYNDEKKVLLPVKKITITYSNDLPIHQQMFLYDIKKSTYVLNSEIKYEYDANQNLVLETEFNAKGQEVRKVKSIFDNNNNKIQDEHFINNKRQMFIKYKYDQNKNLLESETYSNNGALMKKVVNTYDDAGIKLQSKIFGGNNQLVQLTKYNKFGSETEIQSYKNNKITRIILKTYNAAGKILEECELTSSNEVISKTEYSYDSLGNLTEVKDYKGNKLSSHNIYRYDNLNQKVEENYYVYNGDAKILEKKVINQYNQLRLISESMFYNLKNELYNQLVYKYEYYQ